VTADGPHLRRDGAASKIQMQGARYLEHLEKITGR
jgi:hypothetical protein